MRTAYFFLAFFILLAILAFVYAIVPSLRGGPGSFKRGAYRDGTLFIRDVSLGVEIADTLFARTSGLSGREALPEGSGMLFIFPEPGRHGFWMKGMRFPIDIVWIENDKVAGISPDLLPPEGQKELPIYYPPGPVRYAVEIPAGAALRYGFVPGDEVHLVRN